MNKKNTNAILRAVGGLAAASLIAAPVFAAGHTAAPKTGAAEFTKLDTNKDGRVSPGEHAYAAQQMFDAMDADKDGNVTADEMTAAHKQVTGKKAEKDDLSAAEKIKVVDTDANGILTAKEHAAGSRDVFTKMDSNKDGFLSKEELDAGHAAMLKKTPS